jgi:MtN3 and saliva related transmembrane protein
LDFFVGFGTQGSNELLAAALQLGASMNVVTLIGYCAGTLTTCSFVPQVVKMARTRRSEDVSAAMLVALAAGALLWVVYGVSVKSAPIILANGVTLVLLAALVVMKVLFRGVSLDTRQSSGLPFDPRGTGMWHRCGTCKAGDNRLEKKR